MKIKFALTYLLLFYLFGISPVNGQVNIVEAFPKLSFKNIVDLQALPGNNSLLFTVSQQGVIYYFANHSATDDFTVFLDLQDQVRYGGEQGLLGLAFHPEFTSNGYFYVNYTTDNPRRTVISRFQVSDQNTMIVDLTSELILLQVEQPYSNHNGGQIQFGPDGYLYISFGDGGSGGDPGNNGQNLSTLLGSMVRIDVDNPSNGLNYGIPSDNPFAGNSQGFREEIYAYGLRNVWRFSFDSEGRLWRPVMWAKNAWEEVHIIQNGDNCGWRIMEGFHCYNPSSGCDQSGLALPVWEYGHNNAGGRSITGGYVSESNAAVELLGKYICADFLSGRFWALSYNGGEVSSEVIAETEYMVSTFGVDNNGELYFADYNEAGKIYKFVGTPVTSVKSEQPHEFSLYQNYPNPFNPTTTIFFDLPETGFVDLRVYNILGQDVALLVNRELQPGHHKITFDASDLSSGIYLYSLKSGDYVAAKKMILAK